MSLAGPLSPSSSGDAAGRGDDARSPPPRISSDGLLPTLPGGRVNSQASMGEVLAGLEQSVLPSLAPISPLVRRQRPPPLSFPARFCRVVNRPALLSPEEGAKLTPLATCL